MRVRFLAYAVLVLSMFSSPVHSRDGYGDRPMVCNSVDIPDNSRLARCEEWIQNAKQPDNRAVSCCADADAYITDDFVVIGGQLFAITTVAYPGVPKGTHIPIPNSKINHAAEDGGNPSGHSVTFAIVQPNPLSFYVYCYFSGTLT